MSQDIFDQVDTKNGGSGSGDVFDQVERSTHGATGSWDKPPVVGSSDGFIENTSIGKALLKNPEVTGALRVMQPFADFTKRTLNKVAAAPGQMHDAMTAPLTPEERAKFGEDAMIGGRATPELVAHRMLIQPSVDEYHKAVDAAANGHTGDAVQHAFGTIPIVGPMLSHAQDTYRKDGAMEAGSELASQGLIGALLEQVPSAVESVRGRTGAGAGTAGVPKLATEQQRAALSSVAYPGVQNKSVYNTVDRALPIIQQTIAEMGVGFDKSLESLFPKRTGLSEAGKTSVRTGGEHAIEVMDRAVAASDRPFLDVLDRFGGAGADQIKYSDMPARQVQTNIVNALEKQAADELDMNPALSKALTAAAEKARTATTFGQLFELKSLANKKSNAIFDKSLGAQINASAEASAAWGMLGDTIRAEMYPELSRMSGTDLRTAGATEAAVMDVRDGVRKTYYNDVLPAQAQRTAMTYMEYLRKGSLFRHNAVARALMINPTPAGEFNTMFARGVGDVPGMPNSVPVYPGPTPPPTMPNMAGTQLDLLAHGEDVNTHPLLAPPPGISTSINQDIFRVQQRADQQARSAPPETLSGTQQSIAEHALPDSPFYPGKTGTHIETVTGPDGKPMQVERNYNDQTQLFSHYQTPYVWNPTVRATSTLSDLQSLANEIDHYLKQQGGPPPNIRVQWEKDLADVRHEIDRRKFAQGKR